MRTDAILAISLFLLSTITASASATMTGSNGEQITADSVRANAKDVLNTTPHIVNTGKVKFSKEAYNSKIGKGPRLDISNHDLESQIVAIDYALNKSTIFSEMSASDLKVLNASTKNIITLKNQAQENQLLLEQKKINTILDKAHADSRLVCVSEKKTGTHHTTRTCRTVADIARTEDRAKDNWRGRNEGKLDASRASNQ